MLCAASQLVLLIFHLTLECLNGWMFGMYLKRCFLWLCCFPPQRENCPFILVSSKSSFSLPPQSMSNLQWAQCCYWNEESSEKAAACRPKDASALVRGSNQISNLQSEHLRMQEEVGSVCVCVWSHSHISWIPEKAFFPNQINDKLIGRDETTYCDTETHRGKRRRWLRGQ